MGSEGAWCSHQQCRTEAAGCPKEKPKVREKPIACGALRLQRRLRRDRERIRTVPGTLVCDVDRRAPARHLRPPGPQRPGPPSSSSAPPPAGSVAPRTAELQLGTSAHRVRSARDRRAPARHLRPPGPQRPGPPSSSSALGRGGDLVRGRSPRGTRYAGLLGCRRLDGGGNPASPDQGGHIEGLSGSDRPDRASGGLPARSGDVPFKRSPWVARYRHCAQRAHNGQVEGEHNAVPGTPRVNADVRGRPDRAGSKVDSLLN